MFSIVAVPVTYPDVHCGTCLLNNHTTSYFAGWSEKTKGDVSFPLVVFLGFFYGRAGTE